MESHFPQGSEDIETATTPYTEFVEGLSPSMRSVEKVMLEVAQSEVPVLLLAENGAGKKATARRIHELSQRGKQLFRSFSCAALESGRFEDAAAQQGLVGEGTVFLAELADLSAKGQARLLQALTEGNSKEWPRARPGAADLWECAGPGSGSEGRKSTRGFVLQD